MLFPGHDYARGSICDRQGDFSGLNKNLLSDNQEGEHYFSCELSHRTARQGGSSLIARCGVLGSG